MQMCAAAVAFSTGVAFRDPPCLVRKVPMSTMTTTFCDFTFTISTAAQASVHRANYRETVGILFLNCLLTIVFATAAVALLLVFGVPFTPSYTCPDGHAYSLCDFVQDFRSVASLVLGVLSCCIFNQRSSSAAQRSHMSMARFAEKHLPLETLLY